MNLNSSSLRRWRLLVVFGLVLGSVASVQPSDAVAATSEPTESSVESGGQPLLEEVAAGEEALQLVGDQLPEAAARNDMSPVELEEVLLADDTAHLDTDGLLFYVDPPAEAVPGDDQSVPLAAPYPLDQTFLLHSKPGSSKTIFLDFDGHVVQDTAWQTSFGLANPFVAAPFNVAGDSPGSFSALERERIQEVWQRVAEDYAPFEVDVTTEDPGFDSINRSSLSDGLFGTRLLITDTPASSVCGSCGGVAYLTAFSRSGASHAYYQPAWCFANSLNDSAKSIAECASHEVGHNVGLDHDGIFGGATYYSGHPPWAPIMGVGYGQPVTQFSKGEYANPSNTEDDFAQMAENSMIPRADDYPAAFASSTPLAGARNGIIELSSDIDTFRYTAPGVGTVTFTASPAQVGPNLDIRLSLFSANGDLLASDAPPAARVDASTASGLGASISRSVSTGQVYYLSVTGEGHLDGGSGYTDYGSIGQYRMSVAGNLDLAPVLTVSSPVNATYAAGAPIPFGATAVDPESGNLGPAIEWSSSRDGRLGSGSSFGRWGLTLGTHVITASVTDGKSTVVSPSISISVVPGAPPPLGVPAEDEMLFYRGDGVFKFYDMTAIAGMIGPFLHGTGYSLGWSSITAVDLDGDGQDELFFYRADGTFRYYDVRPNGSLGSLIQGGSGYSKGWTSVSAVDLDGDGQDELFFYRADGTFRFYDVRPNGSLGALIRGGTGFTKNWTIITAVNLDGNR